MPRKPQVRFWNGATRNGFYCQHRGKQYKLGDGPDDSPNGPNYERAVKAFLQLMQDEQIDQAGNENTVRSVCNAYLTAQDSKRRQSTMSIRQTFLRPLVERFGDVRVSALKPFHLTTVMDAMHRPRKTKQGQVVTWTAGTDRIFLASVKAAFNWALEQELISRHPFRSVKPPRHRSKARERLVTLEEHAAVLAEMVLPRSQPIRRLIVALENTGARPGELSNATAGDWNDQLGAIVYYADDSRREDEFAHKTSGKDINRTIRFTGEALQMVRELVANRGKKDLLFPTRAGQSLHGQRHGGRLPQDSGAVGAASLRSVCVPAQPGNQLVDCRRLGGRARGDSGQ